VTVIGGPIERDPKSRDVVLNPSVLVEVLSDSTEEWDQGEKLEHYQRIPALAACLLVSHRQRRLTVVSRAEDGAWKTAVFGPGETALLTAIGCSLPVDEVYRNV
jgi:Uma2 family endonuclease